MTGEQRPGRKPEPEHRQDDEHAGMAQVALYSIALALLLIAIALLVTG